MPVNMELSQEEAELIRISRKQAAQKQANEWQPRPASDYSVDEKVAFFDQMHQGAMSSFAETKKNRYHNEDDPHYTWESVMQILAWPGQIKEFWKVWNSLCG